YATDHAINANTACRGSQKVSKSLKFQRFLTISHMSVSIRANPPEKNSKKKKHEYFFRTFPADHLNSTPTPMNTAYIGCARPIAGTPSA
ncbi:hypothetical protein, partial [Bifidobacterium pseudocatenulatum]|uniref:hypothetical protein n=1 Tax=Bifidobacterium pseudocatenulatum TaxID=28026 RepID=UPI0034A35C2B